MIVRVVAVSKGLLFLVDEHAFAAGVVLRALGHDVRFVAEVLGVGVGADDEIICKHANDIGAIVVTNNKKHFAKRLSRRPQSNPRKYRCAGAVYISDKMKVRPKPPFTRFDSLIRKEAEGVLSLSDPRLIVDISSEQLIVHG